MSAVQRLCILLLAGGIAWGQASWTEKAANDWDAKQPWRVGSDYIPANAINELEMWQDATFDPKRIDLELGWAQGLGMNTMRVFLHDLMWQDPAGSRKRIDEFLKIAARHKIKPMLVLFDSCWDPAPHLGKQHPPTPGVHNSGWLQSPGAAALKYPAQYPRLRLYVQGVVGAFAKDKRILAWDIWNEPDNMNNNSYRKLEPENKVELVLALLPQAFAWARSAHPTQPLTSGVWQGDWDDPAKLAPMAKVQLDESDVISFHNYGDPADFDKHVKELLPLNRPVLCTEYMARGRNSTFQGILPIAKRYKVAAINWGLVAGKTQTYYPWDSWQRPYVLIQPTIWFHEVFKQDDTPYRQHEVDLIRELTGRGTAAAVATVH